MIVVAQWLVLAIAIGLGLLWTPALILFWAIPFIAVIGDRSAFGAPIYAPGRFLMGPIAMACWIFGAVGLYDLIM